MSLHNFHIIKTTQLLCTACLLLTGKIHSEQCAISTLQLGGSYTYANIKIDDQSSFNGNLGGVQGSYEYNSSNGLYAGIRAGWKEGNTKSSFGHRNLVYVDVQERLGYTYSPNCFNGSFTVFTGFGYRYLGHKLKQHNVPSVKFEYNEFYVPVGLISEYLFSPCWSIGFNFTWMPQIYPTVKIVPLKGARWILKNTLGNILIELPLTRFLTCDKRYALILKPFYERWEDGRSTAKTANGQKLDLPKNSYNFWGVELNLSLSF